MDAPTTRITIPQQAIEDFCKRHHIRKLAVFGSVLRQDFAPDSDIDVLVEFDPNYLPGFAFFDMQRELSDMLGKEVDLLTFSEVRASDNYIRRRHILNSAQVVYDLER